MKFLNSLLGVLNIVMGLVSLPIIGFGLYLVIKLHTECAKFLQWPAITVGAFILVLALVGAVSAFSRVRWLLILYLIVICLLLVGLVGFTAFAFVVTSAGGGHAVPGKAYEEYSLSDYSSILRQRIVGKVRSWEKIKSCLVQIKVCKSLLDKNYTLVQFNKLDLPPIQSGCCKPPSACNFTYKSSTQQWTNATKTSADGDCRQWSNVASKLCFECDSCRAATLQTAKAMWRKAAMIVSFVLIALLVVIIVLGCCVCTNTRKEEEDEEPGSGYYVKA